MPLLGRTGQQLEAVPRAPVAVVPVRAAAVGAERRDHAEANEDPSGYGRHVIKEERAHVEGWGQRPLALELEDELRCICNVCICSVCICICNAIELEDELRPRQEAVYT